MQDQIEKDTTDNEGGSEKTVGKTPRRLGLTSLVPVVGIVTQSGVHVGMGNKVWSDDWLAPK